MMISFDSFWRNFFSESFQRHLVVSSFVVVAVLIFSIFVLFYFHVIIFYLFFLTTNPFRAWSKSRQTGLGRLALFFPVFITLGQFRMCVRVWERVLFGLFERAISNVVPSLLYTEDFQQPIASSHVASASEQPSGWAAHTEDSTHLLSWAPQPGIGGVWCRDHQFGKCFSGRGASVCMVYWER